MPIEATASTPAKMPFTTGDTPLGAASTNSIPSAGSARKLAFSSGISTA